MAKPKAKPSPAPWIVNPDYNKENVYRIWDKTSNYHDDTSVEVMDANCKLIAAAPDLLELLHAALEFIEPVYVNSSESVDWRAVLQEQAERWMFEAKETIAKAEGK